MPSLSATRSPLMLVVLSFGIGGNAFADERRDGGVGRDETEVVPTESPVSIPSLLPPAPPAGPPAERERWLKLRIEEILARPALVKAKVGVSVAEVDSGRVVYARNDGALYNPASNVKVVTTVAALAVLGPEFRFKTALL